MISARIRLAALTLLLAAVSAHAARMSLDDLMRVRSLLDVQISPDGRSVAYVVSTPSLSTGRHEAVLYVVPASGGEPLRLTYSTHIFNQPLPAPLLRWSPDGKLITFLGSSGDAPQVYAIALAGGEAYPLTSIKQGAGPYEWSPDGKQIAFLSRDPMSEDEAARHKNGTYFSQSDQPRRGARLWVQDVTGGTPKAITPAEMSVVDFNWSPDSRSLVYSASREPGFFAQYKSSLYLVAAEGGEPRVLLSRPGMNRAPRYSPDGKWVAFVSSGGDEGMINGKDLFVIAAGGSASTLRKLSDQCWVNLILWQPDSKAIFYLTQEQTGGSGAHIFEQPVLRVPLDGGKTEVVTPGPYVAYSPSFSRDGALMAYKQVGARDAGDVYLMSLSTRRATRLVEVNPQLSGFELATEKAVSWKGDGGAEVWGLLLTPAGFQPGQHIPLIVYAHGGPIGGVTYGMFPQFMHIPGQVDPYPAEVMAENGVAILFPMPRGGSGYGIAGFRAILKSWGEIDYRDIMDGVDAMIARGIADPNRLGIMGASYGGYMTNWVVTQTSRFKAASAGASLCDLAQMFYLSDSGEVMAEYFGVPWEDSDDLLKHSPITFVRNVTTPLLLQHGEADMRVPISQPKEFYKALHALHKTVELDTYPRGGHVNTEPPMEREYWRRNLEWFSRWLKLDFAASAK